MTGELMSYFISLTQALANSDTLSYITSNSKYDNSMTCINSLQILFYVILQCNDFLLEYY